MSGQFGVGLLNQFQDMTQSEDRHGIVDAPEQRQGIGLAIGIATRVAQGRGDFRQLFRQCRHDRAHSATVGLGQNLFILQLIFAE